MTMHIENISQLPRIACISSILLLTACAGRPSLPDPLEAKWRGVSVCENLHEDSDQRILRCSFPPGVGHERHFHPRHFGYAISGGRMRITDTNGTRDVDLATGSSFTSGGVAWHEVLNIGDTTVVYLIVEPT
jgi:mannose-6-phosphate isomerase-like protein (cupin superfamily)